MSKVDPRKLKDEAAEAVTKGKWKTALERYLALERIEPRDGSWPQRAGEMSRKLGRNEDAINLLDRAANVFAHGGFLLKAIAVCKIILEIDADHTQTQAKLAQFYAARGMSPPPPRTPGVTSAPIHSASVRPAKVITSPSPTAPQSPAPQSPAPQSPAPQSPPAPRSPSPATPPKSASAASRPVAAAPPARAASPPAATPPPRAATPAAPARPLPPPPPPPLADEDWSEVLEEEDVQLDTVTVGGVEPAAVDAAATQVEVHPEAELDIDPPAVPAAPRRAAPPPPPPDALTRKLPPGAPLAEMSLGNSVPGARQSQDFPSPDVFEIPLEEPATHAAEPSTHAAEAARAIAPRTPLFSALDEFRLRLLIERVRFVRIDAGRTLFRRGDPPDCLYVVAQGEVAVLGEKDVEIARLGEGAFFGEIALLTNQPRSATIRAVAETNLLALDRDTIGDLVSNSPEFVKVLLSFMRDRLLASLVQSSPLFAPFSGEERRHLVAKFRFLEVESGALLIEQGKRSPGLFILLAGRMTVSLDGKPIVDLSPGDLLGEISLLTQGGAIASVRAASKAYLLELPRGDFQELIMTHPQVLEFVNQLAEDRKKLIAAILSGKATYGEGRVPVIG